MPHPFGLEASTVLGLDPVRHVVLAADVGCKGVSISLDNLGPDANPHGYPRWSLREEPALRRELQTALADHGVSLSCAGDFALRFPSDAGLPHADERARDLDILAGLGAWRIGAADMGAERGRALDEAATLAQMADERGITVCIAFSPVYTIRTLAEALQAVDHAGAGRAAVLIDTLHFFRSGGKVAQIAALDPALIGHVRLSDAPRRGEGDYTKEAARGRVIPGQGELPLRQFVEALPRGQLLGLEVPLIAAAASGRLASDYVGEIVRRTREFLA